MVPDISQRQRRVDLRHGAQMSTASMAAPSGASRGSSAKVKTAHCGVPGDWCRIPMAALGLQREEFGTEPVRGRP